MDSSAVIAIIREEPQAARLAAVVEAAPTIAMSVATVLETSIVMGTDGQDALDRILLRLGIDQRPVDRAQLDIARAAYLRYGRGSGSRARLNYGDCFSYALAMTTGEALLFKGNDFTLTDVTPAYVPD